MAAVPPPDPTAHRRVFLHRGTTTRSLRSIENIAEILPLVERFGFEVVDSADLTLAQQMQLFGQTGYLVGIHGAGMINTIFRGGLPLHLMELMPSRNMSLFFYSVCRLFGYHHSYLFGSAPGPLRGGDLSQRGLHFSVDPTALQGSLETMLSGAPASSPGPS